MATFHYSARDSCRGRGKRDSCRGRRKRGCRRVDSLCAYPVFIRRIFDYEHVEIIIMIKSFDVEQTLER